MPILHLPTKVNSRIRQKSLNLNVKIVSKYFYGQRYANMQVGGKYAAC